MLDDMYGIGSPGGKTKYDCLRWELNASLSGKLARGEELNGHCFVLVSAVCHVHVLNTAWNIRRYADKQCAAFWRSR
jgi:hypothetical protein